MEPPAYCFHKTFAPSGPSAFQMERHYLLYALEGTLRLEAQGQRWTLPPARAALIQANEEVTITILSQLTSASVLFAPSFMSPPPQVLCVFDLSPLAHELIRECRDFGPDGGPLPVYAMTLFTTLAEVVLKLAQSPSKCVLPSPSSPALLRAVQLTEDQAHGAPTFTAIAKASNQSPRALARRFSSEMGMTWREVLRRIRIVRAVEMLAMTEASVTEIAHQVGYGSLSGFNAAFRDHMGLSPTEYRASFKR
ncbi:helix-turn-helix transcriptional regulator [Litoreibacter roseus]|uniref:AraC family transcriptional regulator n=1 Tax=Litoreibacter roseus TaxID=2601869 RepID=A0A6N6JCK6_9RHOB|nr:AraC family transcriptional regulator [Litoreibacter roseus]GFE64063.1 AraC family transcriptional regulator [Litoreibacter roseus]